MAHKIRTLSLPVPAHIWLVVSAEDQRMAESRISCLLELPSAVRWVSAEPLLGPVDLGPYIAGLQWVVVGGESRPGRRRMDYDWARSLRDQCASADVPFFYKQGNAHRPGGDDELDGRVHQEMPTSNS